MEQEKEFKNFRSWDEAAKIWNDNVLEADNDYAIFYVLLPEPKEQLIGVENVDDEFNIDHRMKILSVGDKVTKYKQGDNVLLRPESNRTWFPIFIEDCSYVVMSSAMIAFKVK